MTVLKKSVRSDNPLSGKHIVFLGSSVTYGAASNGVSFVDFLAEKMGCRVTKEAVSGTMLVDDAPDSYICRMRKLNPGMKVDLFVCQLSTNDATQMKELGEACRTYDMDDFDTLTVAGFLCKFATCQLHGRKWTALYSEDIPTSAGPWKLCGLPGLILKAETNDGIHRFTLASLQRIASPIYYETNAITSKTTEEKLIKNRIKTFGNRLYPKNPYYYITVNLNRTADVTSTNEGMIINNVFVNDKAHVYQPLEAK